MVEGACRGAMSLARRSSKSFPQKQAQDVDAIRNRLLSSDSERADSIDSKSTASEVMSSHASRRELLGLHEKRKASPEESVKLLNAAMSSGQTKKALALIASKKLDLRAANELPVPPLQLAILKDWTDVALALIADKTVNLHLKKERGFTYLTVAIENGNVEIVKALLEYPDRLGDYDMGIALSLASRKGNIAIVELLLNQRKDSPEDKRRASLLAKGSDKDRIIELLRNLPSLDEAILEGSTDVALALIADETVDLNVKIEGSTYLEFAIEEGNLEVVKALLEHKDRLGNYDMRMPLSLASCTGNLAIVELLLKQRTASSADKALARLEASGPDKDRIIELLRDVHGKLIDLAGMLYPEANKDGICHGFALMGMHAILLGQVDQFNDRLERLSSIASSKIHDMIQEFKRDRGPKEKPPENIDFDLIAFLEDLHICMDGYEYKDLIDPKTGITYQSSKNFIKTALSIVASEKLEEKGAIVKINNEVRTAVYTKDELAAYFSSLKARLNTPPALQNSIAIVLSTVRDPHAITVGYEPTGKNWIFVDANREYAEKVIGDDEIAEKVMKGFDSSIVFDDKIDGSVAIASQIYAINNYEQERNEIDAFIQNRDIDQAVLKIKELPSPKDRVNLFLKIIPLDDRHSWNSFIEGEPISRCRSMKAACLASQAQKQSISIKENLQEMIDSLERRIIDKPDKEQVEFIQSAEIRTLETKEALLNSNFWATWENQDKSNPWSHLASNSDWLTLAFKKEDLVSINNLLRAGIDLNGEHGNGVPLLIEAMFLGHTDIALALIASKKLDLRAANELDSTPLYIAIVHGCTDVALALIADETVDLNVKRAYFTYLEFAIENGNLEVTKALLEHKDRLVDYDIALARASRAGNLAIVKLLLEHKDYLSDFDIGLALSEAIDDGRFTVVKLLLELKDRLSKHMGTALSLASIEGNLAIVELLLKQGKASPEDKRRASLMASGPNKEQIIKLLE